MGKKTFLLCFGSGLSLENHISDSDPDISKSQSDYGSGSRGLKKLSPEPQHGLIPFNYRYINADKYFRKQMSSVGIQCRREAKPESKPSVSGRILLLFFKNFLKKIYLAFLTFVTAVHLRRYRYCQSILDCTETVLESMDSPLNKWKLIIPVNFREYRGEQYASCVRLLIGQPVEDSRRVQAVQVLQSNVCRGIDSFSVYFRSSRW